VISFDGLKPDPDKLKAVQEMPAPDSKEAVRRFLGFIQYLSKLMPMLAEVEEPLRELTRNDVQVHWDKPQEESFQHLKELCCKAPVLAYYDVNKPTTIQCDASKYAIGAVLLQEGRPIAYTSRKLSASEINWVPIEKEMLE
jgi:phosphoribosylanthranilate isomerase